MKTTVIKDHFDPIAPKYDNFKNRNHLYYETLKRAIKKEIKNGSLILDIGCGTGEVLFFLKPKNGLGVDISGNMIKLARAKFKKHKNLQFKVFDIEKKPFKNVPFEYILFNDVIEHVINQKKTIKNIALSMNEKSLLILSMANPLWEPLLLIMEKLGLKMPEGPHKRISEHELLDLFSTNNLYVKEKKVYFPHISVPKINTLGLIYVYVVKKNK